MSREGAGPSRGAGWGADQGDEGRETTPGVRQESDRIRTWWILLALFGATAFGGLGVLWAGLQLRGKEWLYRPAGEETQRGREVVVGPTTVGGIYQTLIGVDSSTALQKARQAKLLESFQWIDEARGIAKISIEQAMDAVIEESRR